MVGDFQFFIFVTIKVVSGVEKKGERVFISFWGYDLWFITGKKGK